MKHQNQKKIRGKRRYFKNKNKETIPLSNEKLNFYFNDGYYCYDKYWVDHIGIGNNSFKARLPHLNCLIRNFKIASEVLSNQSKPFQIWIFLNEINSYDDKIYFHSENPIEEFPHKYKEYSFENNFKNKRLTEYVNSLKDFKKIFGTYFTESDSGTKTIKENFCALFKEDIGVSIL
ncbi:MAG: hypothetical protein R2852_07495 [Bacteroidia bacterium]